MAVEIVAIIALLINSVYGGLIALLLFAVYTIAISINLIRGRKDIDCGCAGPAVRQTLSGWLVLRNLGFAAIAALTLLPATASRELSVLDWFTAAMASVTSALLYHSLNYLMSPAVRLSR